MAELLDRAPDVAAFCKNAGPQALRIDYLTQNGRLSLYTPDFIARLQNGNYALVETKGRADLDTPLKARASVAWCDSASKKNAKWQYLYVPQDTFEAFTDNELEKLVQACAPGLQDLLREAVQPQLALPFGDVSAEAEDFSVFISAEDFSKLPPRYQKATAQAISLFRFYEKKQDISFAPVLAPLLGVLDDASKAAIIHLLSPDLPVDRRSQRDFFDPDLNHLRRDDAKEHKRQADNLRRTLVDQGGLMPIGLLLFMPEVRATCPVKRGWNFPIGRESLCGRSENRPLRTRKRNL